MALLGIGDRLGGGEREVQAPSLRSQRARTCLSECWRIDKPVRWRSVRGFYQWCARSDVQSLARLLSISRRCCSQIQRRSVRRLRASWWESPIPSRPRVPRNHRCMGPMIQLHAILRLRLRLDCPASRPKTLGKSFSEVVDERADAAEHMRGREVERVDVCARSRDVGKNPARACLHGAVGRRARSNA